MHDARHPRVRFVATAVPRYEVEQDVAEDFAHNQYGDVLDARYFKVFDAAGVPSAANVLLGSDRCAREEDEKEYRCEH